LINIAKKVIEIETDMRNFTLLDYQIEKDNSLNYKVELKKTEEADTILRSLREMKRNKHFYIKVLAGKE